MRLTPLRCISLVLLGTLAFVAIASAKPTTKRKFARAYDEVKGSKLDACATCHVGDTAELNPYGLDLQGAKDDFAAVEKADSDGDGMANLDEIKALSFPGDAKDKPGKAAAADTSKGGKGAKRDSSGTAEPDSSGRKVKPEKEKDEEHQGGGKPRFPWSPGFTAIKNVPDTMWMLAAHEPTGAR